MSTQTSFSKSKAHSIRRTVEVYYLPSQISEYTIQRIQRYYVKGTELTTILRMINTGQQYNQNLAIVDLYAVLYHAQHSKKLRQRVKFLDFELRLIDFPFVLKAWQHGYTLSKTVESLEANSKVGKQVSKIAIGRLYNSLNHRYNQKNAKLRADSEQAAIQVLSKSHTTIIDGRLAYVIFKDELDDRWIEETGLPTEEGENSLVNTVHIPANEKLDALLEEELKDNSPLSDLIEMVREPEEYLSPIPLVTQHSSGPELEADERREERKRTEDRGMVEKENAFLETQVEDPEEGVEINTTEKETEETGLTPEVKEEQLKGIFGK